MHCNFIDIRILAAMVNCIQYLLNMKNFAITLLLSLLTFAFISQLDANPPAMSSGPRPVQYVGDYNSFGSGRPYLNIRVPIGYSYRIIDIFLEDTDQVADSIFKTDIGDLQQGETAVHIGLLNRITGTATNTGLIKNQLVYCPPMSIRFPQDTTISFFNSGISEYDKITVTFEAIPTDLVVR